MLIAEGMGLMMASLTTIAVGLRIFTQTRVRQLKLNAADCEFSTGLQASPQMA